MKHTMIALALAALAGCATTPTAPVPHVIWTDSVRETHTQCSLFAWHAIPAGTVFRGCYIVGADIIIVTRGDLAAYQHELLHARCQRVPADRRCVGHFAPVPTYARS